MVSTQSDRDADLKLVAECLRQEPGSVERLHDTYHVNLRSILQRRGASVTEAEDILDEMWAHSVVAKAGGGEPLLTKYRGKCSLKIWLVTVATHRLVDLKRRERFRGELPHSNDGEETGGPFDNLPGIAQRPHESDLALLLNESLRVALSTCTAEERIMIRLVYFEDITQRELGRVWGWHESKVSRVLTHALDGIAERTLATLQERDPRLDLTWEDFQELCGGLLEAMA